MFVEGTLRWQVTEDCPWDLLMALALRDLGGLVEVGDPVLPAVLPAPVRVDHPVGAVLTDQVVGTGMPLGRQWELWWAGSVDRRRRSFTTVLRPPHFQAFDRTIELQDLVLRHYDAAFAWSAARHEEYLAASLENRPRRSADIVDVVRDREHELRRQAGYFRLDLVVLPLAESGAWIVGPDTVVVSRRMREDSDAFRAWFAPLVEALV